MSTLAVVEGILRDTKVPMSVREIVERAGTSLPTKSKTPDTVVARDLSMDIKKRGEESLFIRTAPGRYTMREFVAGAQPGVVDGAHTVSPETVSSETVPPQSPNATDGVTPVLGQALGAERAGPKPATEHRPSSGEESATA